MKDGTGLRIAWKPNVKSLRSASHRLRCAYPLQVLRKAGVDCEQFVSESVEYDVVVFQKAYGDDDCGLARRLRRRGVTTVLDLCDNHFRNDAGRSDHEQRYSRLMRMVDAVDGITVSTPELQRYVPRPSHVVRDALERLPTDIRFRCYFRWHWLRRMYLEPSPRRLRVVWFGTSAPKYEKTGIASLVERIPELTRIDEAIPLKLFVLTDSPDAISQNFANLPFPVALCEWELERAPWVLLPNDVCILPAATNSFTACKTANRLILALQLGLPVVADSIPSYAEFSPFVVLDDWLAGTRRYARQSSARRRDVKAGCRYIRTHWTDESLTSQWLSALGKIARGRVSSS